MATSRQRYPRIVSLGTAAPPHEIPQDHVLAFAKSRLLGEGWEDDAELRTAARQMERLFAASRVECRQSVVDLIDYYAETPTTGERMATYREAGARAWSPGDRSQPQPPAGRAPKDVTDLTVVSCTGYSAPGIRHHSRPRDGHARRRAPHAGRPHGLLRRARRAAPLRGRPAGATQMRPRAC